MRTHRIPEDSIGHSYERIFKDVRFLFIYSCKHPENNQISVSTGSCIFFNPYMQKISQYKKAKVHLFYSFVGAKWRYGGSSCVRCVCSCSSSGLIISLIYIYKNNERKFETSLVKGFRHMTKD